MLHVSQRESFQTLRTPNWHHSQGFLLSVLIDCNNLLRTPKELQNYWNTVNHRKKEEKSRKLKIRNFFHYHWQRIVSPSIIRASQGCHSKRRTFFLWHMCIVKLGETFPQPESTGFLTNGPLMFTKKYGMSVDVASMILQCACLNDLKCRVIRVTPQKLVTLQRVGLHNLGSAPENSRKERTLPSICSLLLQGIYKIV